MRRVGDAIRHCEQCSFEVHDLNAMTEADARALLQDQAGARLCVRYQSDRHGRIRFADSDTRRPSLAWSALAAAASLVALVACTSHGPPTLEIIEDEPAFVQWRIEPAAPEPTEQPEPAEQPKPVVNEEIPSEGSVAPAVTIMGEFDLDPEPKLELLPINEPRDFSEVLDLMPTSSGDFTAIVGLAEVELSGRVSQQTSQAGEASRAERRRERRRARRDRRRRARRN